MKTKYDMALAMADIFGFSKDHLNGDKNPPLTGVPRPKYNQLSCERLEGLGIKKYTPFNDGIKMCLEKFVKK